MWGCHQPCDMNEPTHPSSTLATKHPNTNINTPQQNRFWERQKQQPLKVVVSALLSKESVALSSEAVRGMVLLVSCCVRFVLGVGGFL